MSKLDDNIFLTGREDAQSRMRLRSPMNFEDGILSTRKDITFNFCSELDKRYECPMCWEVLKNPVIFEGCGHRCCASCLPEIMRSGAKCPIDQVSINREKEVKIEEVFGTFMYCDASYFGTYNVSVDKEFMQELELLELKCSFVDRGCTWLGQMKDLKAHLEDCRYATVSCPKRCGAELEKSELRAHLHEECPRREIRCDFCNIPILYEQEAKHLQVCGKFLIPCPNGCKKGEVPREEIAEHLENKCPKQEVPCPFQEAGCDFVSKRKHMHKHIKDDPIQHLGMACDIIINHSKQLEENEKVLQKHTTKLQSMDKRVDALEKLYGCQLVWKIEKWNEKVDDAKLGKKPTIFSPPFLTSRHGYKMAMSLCPYGDGRARSKFLSIFICICRGEYDALLTWPFCHQISFTLIDQCQDPAARRNITYTIKPNVIRDNKAFLGRPVGERNASFGAQKFVELDVVKTLDYVRDDCLFLKCTIDSEDMILL